MQCQQSIICIVRKVFENAKKIKSKKDRCQIFSSYTFLLHSFGKFNILQFSLAVQWNWKKMQSLFELSKNGFISITRSINLENEVEIESKCDKTQNVWSFLWTTATYCFFYKMYLWHALIVTTRKICEQQMINSASFSPNTEIR